MTEEKKLFVVSFIGEDGDGPSWSFEFKTLPEALAKVSEVMTSWRGYYAGGVVEYTATHYRRVVHFDTFPTKNYTDADKWRRRTVMGYGELTAEGEELIGLKLR